MTSKTTHAALVLRRLEKVVFPKAKEPVAENVFWAGWANLNRLGYRLDDAALEAGLASSQEALQELLKAARELKGERSYEPMYRNFPQEVASLDEMLLLQNAAKHYQGGAKPTLPNSSKAPRTKLFQGKLTTLTLFQEKAFPKLAEQIITQGQPYSATDLEDLRELAHFVTEPVEVKVRENIATLFTLFPKLDWSASVKTLTDVLRVAAGLSGGDTSLAEATRFRLTRPQRRLVLTLLLQVLTANGEAHEDFARQREPWKRLAKTLHLKEAKSEVLDRAADAIYRETAATFASRVEAAFKLGALEGVIGTLEARPGEFARALHRVLRAFPHDRKRIIEAFTAVAPGVSLRVLVQLRDFFSSPDLTLMPQRPFTVKSRTVKGATIPNTLVGDQSDVLAAIEAGFKGRLSTLKIAADTEQAAMYTIPMGVRTAAEGTRLIGRGSRVKFDEAATTVRLFMHWRNNDSSIDLDLSGMLVTADFKRSMQIAYTNLRDGAVQAYHSGDITDAPSGAAEFIDFNIAAALKKGYRYLVPTVHVYRGPKLAEVPDAWAGAMLRSSANDGEIFEPATVETRYALRSEARNSMPMLFDLETRELIWWDFALNRVAAAHNIHAHEDGILEAMQLEALSRRTTVADVLRLTGAKLTSEKQADLKLDPRASEQVLNLLNS